MALSPIPPVSAESADRPTRQNQVIQYQHLTDKDFVRVTGALAILMGPFGVHKFILGRNKTALATLTISLFGGYLTGWLTTIAMAVVGLTEGVIYLTKTPHDFKALYIDSRKSWF